MSFTADIIFFTQHRSILHVSTHHHPFQITTTDIIIRDNLAGTVIRLRTERSRVRGLVPGRRRKYYLSEVSIKLQRNKNGHLPYGAKV